MRRAKCWLLLLIVFIVACQEKYQGLPKLFYGELNATVGIYYGINDIDLTVYDRNTVSVSLTFVAGDEVAYSDRDREGGGNARFLELQNKVGDYNTVEGIELYLPDGEISSNVIYSDFYIQNGPRCFYECIEDITITALTDYNELLTACSDLSDLFTVEYQSVMPYIERGFTGDKQTVVVQKVADIAQNPIKLLCTEPLKFTTTTLPTNESAKIEFCFTLDSGRSVKAVCELY